MKKHLLLLAAAFVSAGLAMADPIDPSRAAAIAQSYAVPGHTLSLVTSAKRTPSKARMLSARLASTSPYYVYSRGKDKGFVIVSGDDCLPEVIGYTEQGDFDPTNLPPALQDMLTYYANVVEDAQMYGTNKTCNEKELVRRAAASRQNIAPFVTAHWHQSSPYNDRCPRITSNGNKALTGCVATAASQILYYWRKDLPNTLQGTTPTYGYGDAPVTESLPKGTPLKWELMRDQYGSEPAEYKEAVADLVFACGAATWLTYGSSTSGNIEKIPATFSGYFGMNGGWVAYRNNYSQEGWTQLLYEELSHGRPVMYTGVHPSQGGHAVFVHGYQASTDKFYFNFGWGAGNGYDGYYTTAQSDGMNGFNEYQSALINAYPKQWNIQADIKAPSHVYANVEANYSVTIHNNSTLPLSGLYLFAATSKSKPTDLKNAKSSDLESVIEVGTSATITLSAKTTSASTWYITLTDANLNVLAQTSVEAETSEPDMKAKSLYVYGLLEKEQHAGHDYTVVSNSKATVTALIQNDAMAFGGTAKLDLYVSEDDGQTFEFLKTVSKSGAAVDAMGESVVDFNVTSVDTDKLYMATVNDTWGTLSLKAGVDVSALEPVYFRLTGTSDLTASLDGTCLTFQGKWDINTFTTLVGRAANKNALNYDLTAVEGVSLVEGVEFPNPNALIYAPLHATGRNVITADGTCADLCLSSGSTFAPKATFTALKATLLLDDRYDNWNLVTVPFDCPVPDGFLARRMDSHTTTSTALANGLTAVQTLEGGHTYLLLSAGKRQLSATDVNVQAAPAPNADAALVGTYAATEVPAGGKVITITSDGKPYFTKAPSGSLAEPLMGYFFDEAMKTVDFRAYSSTTLDPLYINLAETIHQLYVLMAEKHDVVSAAANRAMTDTIASAEHKFSVMEFTSTSQVRAYIKLLNAFAVEYENMLASMDDVEIDMTSLINNPSFDESATVARGWTVEGSVKILANSNLNNTTFGPANPTPNFLSAEPNTVVTQVLSGLQKGTYRLSAWVGAPVATTTITLMAGEQTSEASAHPFGKHYLTQVEISEIEVGEEGTLTIGVTANDNFLADEFCLTFLGSDEDTFVQDVTSHAVSTQGNAIYNLSGQRVADTHRPGIYIIGGKKIVKTNSAF